jgi:hypothetical protein
MKRNNNFLLAPFAEKLNPKLSRLKVFAMQTLQGKVQIL